MMTQIDYVLGIDLGTTNCCNAVYINKRVEIIPNASGGRTTPSYVSFYDNEKLIGESAKNVSSTNSQNTVFDIKRLTGRKFNEKCVQTDIKHFPFKVTKDEKTEKPLININYFGEQKDFLPEQLSAFLLRQLKDDAESYLGCQITKAVITVPAYFNNEQRESTKLSGEIAGLNVIRIINEPTASAIAFGINLCESEKIQEKNIVVFDFGGGTLDVSILNIENGIFEVKSTSGDTHLGGEDCDNRLVSFCASEFSKTHGLTETEIKKLIIDTKALRRLRTACENAKKVLSSTLTTCINVDAFFGGIDLAIKLTRAKFEELCYDLFNKCLEPLNVAIHDANLHVDDINDVILIGGSTRIPYVRNMIQQYFNKMPRSDVNPDEAVAIGAAMHGAILNNNVEKTSNDIILIDVTPISLGVEISHGEMSKIVEKNTTIPCSHRKIYSTETDNQRSVKIKVYEGERTMVKDNTLLGTFELSDLPPLPRGILRVMVDFSIDANGILKVSACEESTGKHMAISINKDKTKFSDDDILKLINDAKKNSDVDEKIKATCIAKNSCETYLYSVKHALESYQKINDMYIDEFDCLNKTLGMLFDWYSKNQDADASAYREKQLHAETIISPILSKLYEAQTTNTRTISNDKTKDKIIAEPKDEVEKVKDNMIDELKEDVKDDIIDEPKEEVKIKKSVKRRKRVVTNESENVKKNVIDDTKKPKRRGRKPKTAI